MMYAPLRQHGLLAAAALTFMAAMPVPTASGTAGLALPQGPGAVTLRVNRATGVPAWAAFRDGDSNWHVWTPAAVGEYAHTVRDARGRFAYALVVLQRTESGIELQRRIVFTNLAETTAMTIPGSVTADVGTRAPLLPATDAHGVSGCTWRTTPEAQGYVLAHTETGADGVRHRWSVRMSADWLDGARTARFDLPDLTDLPGWQGAWNFPFDDSPRRWRVTPLTAARAVAPVSNTP